MDNFTRILRESSPVLVLCIIGELFAGIVLASGEELIALVPGLLILFPAVLSLRGNISSALGSRLGSAIHLGLIDARVSWMTFRGPTVKENIAASTVLNIMMSFLLGILAYLVSVSIGLNANLFVLVFISLLAGLLSGVFLIFLTLFLAVFTASKGLDPDNVLTPSVATIGDIFTVLFLFISAQLALFLI